MNAETHRSGARFVDRLRGLLRLGQGASVLENPTEELLESVDRKRRPKLHSMAGPPIRVEENYFYSTRRFPNLGSNTIGSGAVAAGDYNFFTMGIGDPGSSAGYFSISSLTAQQTNMAAGGRIPTGRGFRLFDLGVSFNASATPGDIAQCLDTMSLSYSKQGAALTISHGPLKFWPGGTGLYGFAATTATTTTFQGGANGMPALTNVRRFRNPRIINANEDIRYVISAQANLPKTNAAVALTDFVEITVWLFGQVLDRLPE